MALVASLFFAGACNTVFFTAVMVDRTWSDPSTWIFVGAMALLLTALHLALLCLVLERRSAHVVLGVVIVTTAFATYYMQRFGVYIDPTMARNVLQTEVPEARELFGWGMLPHLLVFAGLPLLLLSRVRLVARTWPRALATRIGWLTVALAVTVLTVLAVFQDFSSLMRNQTSLRYLVTPANIAYSVGHVLLAETREAVLPTIEIGLDAALAPSWAERRRPVLLVIVVGETARAANWGLSGYARQTTPQLAALDVINFRDVTACGTNTEVSLPCMFAPVGRRDYNEDRIRNSQSLLHVLDRAGFRVTWIDNQSGCKGVCDGLREERADVPVDPALCADGRCLDEVLLRGVDRLLKNPQGNAVLVLHMLGNHGPSYFKRYPPAFRRFEPTCDTGELRKCERQAIVNAYDNALLYTDHVVAQAIKRLQGASAHLDSALIYVSDHGESLGEKGLYLHGVPYAIAPAEQTQVPMVWWLSKGYAESFGLQRECLLSQAAQPATHDHLFHSTLGLLQVQVGEYERKLDLSATCRR